MTIDAKVILDSVAPNGVRLTTFELTYPRFIHAELMTHRVFSRNAASSRAIPVHKKLARIRKDPAKPTEWGLNKAGMQSAGPVDAATSEVAERVWLRGRDNAVETSEILAGIRCANCYAIRDYKEAHLQEEDPCACPEPLGLDLHKQVSNRVSEAYDHITVVLSSTKYVNHFKLRTEVDANGRPKPDPTYFELATKWKAAWDASKPRLVGVGEWHLPYVSVQDDADVLSTEEDDAAILDYLKAQGKEPTPEAIIDVACRISVGRCARVSYMRQGQGDVEDNLKLAGDLMRNGHWSPMEHQATPMSGVEFTTGPAEDGDWYACLMCMENLHGKKHVRLKLSTLMGLERAKEVHKETYDDFYNFCMKCALGHVTSGNFHGWTQFRKTFAGEAGGD